MNRKYPDNSKQNDDCPIDPATIFGPGTPRPISVLRDEEADLKFRDGWGG